MTKLEQIEKSVAFLSVDEVRQFAAWFDELRWQRWDRKIEADSKSGRLDDILDRVRAEIARGETAPL